MEQKNLYELTLGNYAKFIGSLSKKLPRCANSALKEVAGAFWLNTQSQYPLFNGYFDFDNTNDDYKNIAISAKKYFGSTPFTIWHHCSGIDTYSNPEELFHGENIQSAGEYKGILLDLHDINHIHVSSDHCSTKQITDDDEYEIYCAILNSVFGLTGTIADDFKNLLSAIEVDNSHVNYLGYYQGKPVATLTSFISDKTVGLYCFATLPDFRKKGVLSSLIKKALLDAKKRGCVTSVAQLMAKNMAEGATIKFGFKTVCHFTPYIHGADANSLEK